MFTRRTLIAGASTSLAFAGFACATRAPLTEAQARAQIQAQRYLSQAPAYGPLVSDPAGLFDLPQGFSYRVLSRRGDRMDDGFLVPGKFDGMAAFPGDDGRVILVRNHELRHADRRISAFGANYELDRLDRAQAYDTFADGRPLGGGTTTLIYDPAAGRRVSEHLSLAGTSTNCAGGATPWGSWLSGEETVIRAGEDALRDHGYVFETPARGTGLAPPNPIRAMGRFKHEAVAIDPRTGIAYMTEDEGDGEGLFYRYLPNERTNLHAGGRLQALAFRFAREADYRNWNGAAWNVGDWLEVDWIDIDGADNPDNDIHDRGHAAGCAWFARGEGIYRGDGEFYFTCTSGGPDRLGQIMRYRPSRVEGEDGERAEPGRIQLFSQPGDAALMRMPDNLTIAPWAHLIVCEDKSGGVNYLKGVTPQGQIYTLGRNPTPSSDEELQSAELAGPCFSPDGSILFLNIFDPGVTLAITGPWASFRA